MSGVAIALGVSAAAAAASTGASFAQMGKQRRARDRAEKAAAKAADEARRALTVAPFEALGLSIDPTQRALDVTRSVGAAGVEVGRESQRGAAAAAGRAQALAGDQAMATRDRFTRELEQRERLIAQDKARRMKALSDMSLAEAEGAQIAAAEAEKMRQQSLVSGLEGIGQLAGVAAQGVGLYEGRGADPSSGKVAAVGNPANKGGKLSLRGETILNMQGGGFDQRKMRMLPPHLQAPLMEYGFIDW